MDNFKNQYYVAIGASAGGLEALESFFRAIPRNSNLIYIVIQHLSPDYKSYMDEILKRFTDIDILMATDGMTTEKNKIYLIPPGKNLSIYEGKLYLEKQKEHNYLTLPIDIFFKSLAKDVGKYAIGIILSGTGSDGTLGIKTIKEAGGMVIVQDEQSAKFDGMPKSAISTGLVDYILPPEEMPKEIITFIESPVLNDVEQKFIEDKSNLNNIAKINLILKNYCNIDFSGYKSNTIIRRLERRTKIKKCSNLEEYIDILRESDSEKESLYKEFLIGVTSFFRDSEAYRSLEEDVLPNLDYSKGYIRVWSAGVSTGEEAYSLAILLLEYTSRNNIDCDIKIFATDIDSKALETAGTGYYSQSLVADIEGQLLDKYFIKKGEGFIVSEILRKKVIFAKHNILKDPPFSKVDLISCRNLFIYLTSQHQQNILSNFYYSVAPKGFVFLGSSESIGEMSSAFTVIDSKWKIYRYRDGYKPALINNLVTTSNDSNFLVPYKGISQGSIRLEKLLMETLNISLPPTVIIDSNENILHIINDVSKYIVTQPGRFSNNFNSNMNKELALYVNNIIRKLKTEKKEVSLNNIPLQSNGNSIITIRGRILSLNKIDFYLLSFLEIKNEVSNSISLEINISEEAKERVKTLETELQLAREGLQATIEELETSNEELQSSNEELIASNEELQSTNEELQSVNEELFTVNNEYQAKIEELVKLNNDLDNLLKNTDIGALYLDKKLYIRKFTPIITAITNIVESDIGRPISHISLMDFYPEFLEDVYRVIDNLVEIDKEIIDKDGKTWLVKLKPYRTEYNSIDGIIMTMVEITQLKKEQRENQYSHNRMNFIMDINKIGWWEYEISNGNINFSPNTPILFGYKVEEFPRNINRIHNLIHPNDYSNIVNMMSQFIKGELESWDVKYRLKRKNETYALVHEQGIISEKGKDNNPIKIIATIMDISESQYI